MEGELFDLWMMFPKQRKLGSPLYFFRLWDMMELAQERGGGVLCVSLWRQAWDVPSSTCRKERHVHTYSQQIESQAFEPSLEEGLSAHADQH